MDGVRVDMGIDGFSHVFIKDISASGAEVYPVPIACVWARVFKKQKNENIYSLTR